VPCVQVDDNEFEFLSLNFVHRGATPETGRIIHQARVVRVVPTCDGKFLACLSANTEGLTLFVAGRDFARDFALPSKGSKPGNLKV